MQNIILTGVTRGLGLELLNHYAKKKNNLILISKNSKRLIALKKKFKKKGIDLHIYSVNFCKINNLKRIITRILIKFGRIDILINNAGIWGPIGNFEKIIWNKWIEAININLIASAYLTRAVLPSMKKNNFGRIIQLSGGGATAPMPNFSSYAVSKTGIVRFVESISEECRRFNISINAVAPGAMNTRMLDIALKAGRKKVGDQYNKLLKQKKEGGVGFDKAIALIDFLIINRKISGKLISAIWDHWDKKNFIKKLNDKNIYTLRRQL